MKFFKTFFKSFTLFLILFSIFNVQNFLMGAEKLPKDKEKVEESLYEIDSLKSLQPNDFTDTEIDCRYFVIYNAIQAVQSKDENSFINSLMDKKQLGKDIQAWKKILDGTTTLDAKQIQEIVTTLQMPKDSIVFFNDSILFDDIKEALQEKKDPSSYLDEKYGESMDFTAGIILAKTSLLLNNLNSLLKNFLENNKPCAIILFTADHKITYGIRKNQNQIKIYITKSCLKTDTTQTEDDQKKLDARINQYAETLQNFIKFKIQLQKPTSTSSLIPNIDKLNSLKKLCKAFEAKPFLEKYYSEKIDKYPPAYFTEQEVESIFGAYSKQAKNMYPNIDFEKMNDAKDIFFSKLQVKDGDNLLCMGDIHGSVHSLLRNLYGFELKKYLSDDFEVLGNNYIICTGDYVDRGKYGMESIIIFLYLKLKNWDKVFLVRGNHERKTQNDEYGFLTELYKKYQDPNKLEKLILAIYKRLPIGLWLEMPDKNWILCTHGGFDPKTTQQIKKTFLDQNEKKYICLPDVKGESYLYDWGDFRYVNKQFHLAERSLTPKKIPFEITDGKIDGIISAIIRGHEHNFAGFKLINTNVTEPTDWQNADAFNQLQLPLPLISTADQESKNYYFPIFTLTTATDMPKIAAPPSFSSYALVKVRESINASTIEPVKTSNDLTILANCSHIINAVKAW
jgi:hypothetical protein